MSFVDAALVFTWTLVGLFVLLFVIMTVMND